MSLFHIFAVSVSVAVIRIASASLSPPARIFDIDGDNHDFQYFHPNFQ